MLEQPVVISSRCGLSRDFEALGNSIDTQIYYENKPRFKYSRASKLFANFDLRFLLSLSLPLLRACKNNSTLPGDIERGKWKVEWY